MAGKYPNTRTVTAEVFWSRVRRSDGCWEYSGAVAKNGYCEVNFNRKRDYAHRIAFMLTFPGWDQSDHVLHHCDNRRCCNPAHLFHGSDADNVADMLNKGRARGALRGEMNPDAKLTAIKVREIRQSPLSQVRLAKLYGVSQGHIWAIRAARKWGHLEPEA